MLTTVHLIRPYWLLAFIPVLILFLWRRKYHTAHKAWQTVCDAHLLPFLAQSSTAHTRNHSLWVIFALFTCVILSLSGPSLYQQAVPVYHPQQARVVLLDLSTDMLATDLSPNRLQRAKFKLHDLFKGKNSGQFALIAYTSEAFVVSPLTDDAQTISALLPELTPYIMPVNGNRLERALHEVQQLIQHSHLDSADILVMTAVPPSTEARLAANKLSKQGSDISIIPMTTAALKPEFNEFADAGQGQLIPFSQTNTDLEHWLHFTQHHQQLIRDAKQTAPIWRDDGRWLLLPAIILFLALFQRNRLESIRP
jgi:Ca-activated chloride channel family protein